MLLKTFSDEILSRISSIIDPAKIDYIVCNHLEADHSGSLDAIAQKCPNATIFVSQPNGLKILLNSAVNILTKA